MNKFKELPIMHYMDLHIMERNQFDPNKTIIENIDKVKWGTYGKDREHELRFKPITSLTTNHLENILRSEGEWISDWLVFIIEYILEQRKNPVPEELFEI